MALNREKVVRNAEKYVSRGKLEAAIKEYRKVLKENPNDTNTLNRVGDLYARLERFDEAVRLFSQIAEKYTDDGFFVKAIAIYKKIIKFDPSALSVYERLAELYHRQGLPNESRSQFQFLADYYLKNNNLTSATTIYQRMAELDPSNPTYKLKLAELYEGQRFPDKSVREYQALARIMLDGNSPDEAVHVYNKALELQPNDLGLVRSSVTELHERGHTGAAAKVLARAVDLNPAAAALADEMHLEEPAADTDPVVPEAGDETDVTVSETPATVDDAFEIDQTFEVPESGFDLDAAAEEAMAAIDAAGPDLDETGTDDAPITSMDLDDDDSMYQIEPPADMGDRPGSVFADDFEVDVEIEMDDDEPGAGDEPSDMDVDFLGMDAELAADFDEEPVEIGADDDESFEIDLEVDLDGFDGEPLEIEADTADELVVDEPVVEEEVEDVVEDTVVEATAVAEDVSEAQPVRREEDLVAEAKVFAKYGLAEKARDRLGELLEVNPEHLEGLQLLARMDLEAEDTESATALAARLADASKAAGESELYDELRGDFAAGGLTLEALDIPGAEPAAPEPAAPEPSEAEPVAPEPAVDLAGDETVFAVVPAAEPEPLTAQPEPEPVLEPEPELVAEEHEPETESVAEEAEPAAPAPPAPAPAPARPAPRKSKSKDRIAQLLEDLSLDSFDAPARKPKKAAKAPEVAPEPAAEPVVPEAATPEPTASDPVVEEPAATEASSEPAVEEIAVPEPEPEVAEAAAEAASEPEPAGDDDGLFSLKDELDLDDLVDKDDDMEPVVTAPVDDHGIDFDAIPAAGKTAPAASSAAEAAPEPATAETAMTETAMTEDRLDETGMSWLQDEAPVQAAASGGGEDLESLFDEEDDFFDLAAELEEELGAEAMARVDDGVSSLESQEGTLEEIIEGFKQGVSEHLSEEDYDTHFNLGIAYREMGLLDEAIGEFQVASKDPSHLTDSAGMLGMCFLEKGLPELAVRWYKKGLEAAEINEDATLGLLYDLATTYESMGEPESAYRTFVEIYGINTNFRDVASKMQELAPQKPA